MGQRPDGEGTGLTPGMSRKPIPRRFSRTPLAYVNQSVPRIYSWRREMMTACFITRQAFFLAARSVQGHLGVARGCTRSDGQFQRGSDVRQAVGPQVEVAQRRGEVAVAEQSLQRGQVGAAFEQVRGVAVPQRVDRRRLPQPRGPAGLLKCPLQGGDVQGLAGGTGEEPVGRAVLTPVGTEFGPDAIRDWAHRTSQLPTSHFPASRNGRQILLGLLGP